MKKVLLLFCFLATMARAQTPRLDSLKRVLGTLAQQPGGLARDTLRFGTLKALMNGYIDVSLDSAMHYTTQTIAFCQQQARLQKELIYGYEFAAYLYEIKGDHYQSIPFHYKALALAERLKQYTRVASTLGGLAHTYNSLKNHEKAIQLCERALTVLRRQPNTFVQMGILNSLAPAYREQQRWADALRVSQELDRVATRQHDVWYQAQARHYTGRIYHKMGNATAALAYYRQAIPLAHQTGSVDLEGSILLNLTQLLIDQKNWPLALTYARQARQKATQVNNSSVAVEADELFYKIYKQTDQTARALAYHEAFTSLKDSLSKERNAQRLESLQAQYDNVQKENALQRQQVQLLAQQNQNQQLAQTRNGLFAGIAAALLGLGLLLWNNRRLQAKNRLIDSQKTQLETARHALSESNKTLEQRVDERTAELSNANHELIRKNEEIKQALFKGQTIERKRVAIELHDNLSSLLSAVNMSMQTIDPQHLSASEQSVYRNVRHMVQNAYTEVRNISHNILPAELEKDGLVAALTILIGQLNQNSPLQFSLTVNDLSEQLPREIEFNVYSIVLELLNNAIKHAQASRVAVVLRRTPDGVDLLVTDDGVGIDQSPAKRGVGLQNIQTRLDSLGGVCQLGPAGESGTCVAVKIPIEVVRFEGDQAVASNA